MRRHITSEGFCLTCRQYLELQENHREALNKLFAAGQVQSLQLAWRAGDTVYLSTHFRLDGKESDLLWEALWPHRCDSPYSGNFRESVSQYVYWYHAENPSPHVLERDEQPYEVRLKDPKGEWISIPFTLSPPPQSISDCATR